MRGYEGYGAENLLTTNDSRLTIWVRVVRFCVKYQKKNTNSLYLFRTIGS